ncbi:MAG: putative Serine/threonine-protein kinase Nek3 [Streblomastix strix]|uniref:non-specific serine/threonine protein kinase n=1 Tax=Streblomastix strix TaxID=222440 RepID=A0A5J4U3P0_9EUKA|nr:MAG: putative Serine/threonine-protein kinase Nek3 [Streblomastix strix]
MSVSEDHFDLYEVITTLGHGSNGIVYKIKRQTDEKLLAYRKILCKSEQEEVTTRKEVEILSNLYHENIIGFVDAFKHENSFYIVMELAEGGDLLSLYKNKKKKGEFVTEEEAWRFLKGITSGVAYLHSNRILHRDIKPGNILLTSDGTVKITDFAIAKKLAPGEDFAQTEAGSRLYVSPEMSSTGQQSFPADIYAVGLTIHEILTLQVPFEPKDKSIISMMKDQIAGKVTVQIDPSRYSKDLIDMVNSMRNVNPKKRQTPEQILAHTHLQRDSQEEEDSEEEIKFGEEIVFGGLA